MNTPWTETEERTQALAAIVDPFCDRLSEAIDKAARLIYQAGREDERASCEGLVSLTREAEAAEHDRLKEEAGRLGSRLAKLDALLASEEPPADFRREVYGGGGAMVDCAWRWFREQLAWAPLDDAPPLEKPAGPEGIDEVRAADPSEREPWGAQKRMLENLGHVMRIAELEAAIKDGLQHVEEARKTAAYFGGLNLPSVEERLDLAAEVLRKAGTELTPEQAAAWVQIGRAGGKGSAGMPAGVRDADPLVEIRARLARLEIAKETAAFRADGLEDRIQAIEKAPAADVRSKSCAAVPALTEALAQLEGAHPHTEPVGRVYLAAAVRNVRLALSDIKRRVGRQASMRRGERKAEASTEPRWEVVLDDDGQMTRVRWSLADDQGRHLYVRHYPGDAWGKNAAEEEAKRFNAEGRTPTTWSGPVGRRAYE